jgi:hypothetical protein
MPPHVRSRMETNASTLSVVEPEWKAAILQAAQSEDAVSCQAKVKIGTCV